MPADMAFELAIRPNASKGDMSQEFVDFVQDLDADQEYDLAVTALLCREAYEIGRKDGGMCSPRETLITLLVVTITILLLGAYLGRARIVEGPTGVFMRGNGEQLTCAGTQRSD